MPEVRGAGQIPSRLGLHSTVVCPEGLDPTLRGRLGAHNRPSGGQRRGWWSHFAEEENSSERLTAYPGLHSWEGARELRSPSSCDSVLPAAGKYKIIHIFKSVCSHGLVPTLYAGGPHPSQTPPREKLPPGGRSPCPSAAPRTLQRGQATRVHAELTLPKLGTARPGDTKESS